MSRAPLPVICLAGPTGSGKTAAALALAAALHGEVVNADSRQVYAPFPIITAQPTPEERARCPHHLYGIVPCTRKVSAGRWAAAAADAARHILNRGRVPLLVGGTGMYFHALLHGMARIPAVPPHITAALAARAAAEGPPALHAELSRCDPAYAARIHPNDRQRIVRALEVFQATGRPFSWWYGHGAEPPLCAGPLLVLSAGLDWLAPRLARRIEGMLASGALEEARAARRVCDDAGAPGWSGIGCAEVLALLQGRITEDECRRRWYANTRAYAKRQLTWFRGRAEARWLPPDDVGAVVAAGRQAWAEAVADIDFGRGLH